MKYFKIILFMLIVATAEMLAQDGGQAGAFLRRDVDSRALSFGGAYTSVTDGASSVYWNPAGLNGITNNEFSAMFSTLSLDRQEYFAAYGHSFGWGFSVGAGWYRFGVNNIDGRDNTGQKTKMFDDSENSFMLGLSKEFRLTDLGKFSVGLTAKYLNHSLYDNSANGFGVDIGVMTTVLEMVRVGFVVQDISSNLKWNTGNETSEDVPMTMRLGASIYPKFFPFALSVDLVKVKDSDIVFKFGAGTQIVKYLGLKAGYNGNNPTFGAFLWYPLAGIVFQLDYAATKDVLQDSYIHHISLALRF